jgi:hypothetical protein
METSQKHPQKFKVTPSAEKVMLTMFRDSQGMLLAQLQKCVGNVIYSSFCKVLVQLRDAIRKKLPGQLREKGTVSVQPELPRREFENCSGNFLNIGLTPRTWPLVTSICCDLFGPLRNVVGCKRLAGDEEFEMEMRKWLRLLCCWF